MRYFIFSIFLGFVFSPTFCFARDYTVAFAQDTLANDYRKAQVQETKNSLAKYPNIKFVYTDAKAKTAMLIYQIEEFIKQKVDVLIIGTNDEKAVVPSLQKAANNHIPVIIVDRGVATQTYTTFINSDNIQIGQIAARYIAQKLNGKGTILLLEGLQTADVTKLRSDGFMQIISQYPNLKVIKATANYLRRDAIIEVEKLLHQGIHFDAIFSESDSMVSGARSALLKHNIKPSSIISIGCDYTSEAQREILLGNQTGSIKFPLAGKQSAQVVLDILKNKEVPKHIVIPVQLVTKENAKQIEPIF